MIINHLKKCDICRGPLIGKHGSVKTCSDKCFLEKQRRRRMVLLAAKKIPIRHVVCKICKSTFETTRAVQLCCSKKCSEQHQRNANVEYRRKHPKIYVPHPRPKKKALPIIPAPQVVTQLIDPFRKHRTADIRDGHTYMAQVRIQKEFASDGNWKSKHQRRTEVEKRSRDDQDPS